MPTQNLMIICGVAFVTVFVVLAVLAMVMRALTLLFPDRAEPTGSIDPAVVAAITQAVTAAYPGVKVTAIEEAR